MKKQHVESVDWDQAASEVIHRNKARQRIISGDDESVNYSAYPETENKQAFAATDLFVEVAFKHLTKRAHYYLIGAGAFFAAGVALLYAFYCYALGITAITEGSIYSNLDTFKFVLVIMNKLVFTSVYLSAIYLAFSFFRAFLHEANVLFSRRHSIRFGRLVVHLSDNGLKLAELQSAFGWNHQPSSAFMKFKPEIMSTSTLKAITDIVAAVRGGGH